MPIKYQGLQVRKHADMSDGERVVRWHPVTGERMVVKPDTINAEGYDYTQMQPEPWPLAGVSFLHEETPKYLRVPDRYLHAAVNEGWATLANESIAHRPGGPPHDPWRVTHTFRHAEGVTFHTNDGDIKYRVINNPDKSADKSATTDGSYLKSDGSVEAKGTRVDHFYDLELIDG